VLYAHHVISGESVPSSVLPAAQKMAALLLLAWLVTTALSARPFTVMREIQRRHLAAPPRPR
jgi:hypothetical protein